MISDDRILELIVKLNRLTTQGKISWSSEPAPRTILSGTDTVIPLYLHAEYKGQQFGLFEMRYRTYDPDHEQMYWTDRLVLTLMDREERVLWEVAQPYHALSDLFATARSQVANVDHVIDDLLSDGDED